MRLVMRLPIVVALLVATTTTAHAQGFPYGEWGDAPNGWAAYWDNGSAGRFPTCFGGGYSYIFHSPNFPFLDGVTSNCYFGPGCDYELDGNAGICSEPYDNDECYTFLDGDAGLYMPTAFTYGPTHQPITCSGLPSTSLGKTCQMARWGRDIELSISNHLNPPRPAYLNMLVDWDRSGEWSAYPAGPTGCGVQIAEHVIRNMPIPPNFVGLASQLGLADFQIGPDSGLVWVRFSITDELAFFPYNGHERFEYGETEDYMIRVAPVETAYELGDAPYAVNAYPPVGAIGQFPTCLASPDYVHHTYDGGLHLGPGSDPESEGNHDDCAFTPHDNDECMSDGDAGLLHTQAYTIDASHTSVGPCGPVGTDFANECSPIAWGTDIDLSITNSTTSPAYLSMLADWDHDGRWQDTPSACPGGFPISERVFLNYPIVPGTTTLLSALGPPPVLAGGAGYVWVRFTLGAVAVPPTWEGGGDMGPGETEDYLLFVRGLPTEAGPAASANHVGEPWPNPARGAVSLEYALAAAADVGMEVFDVNGRRVHAVEPRVAGSGRHRLEWDARNAMGRRVPTGVYFIHVRVGSTLHRRRALIVN